MIIQTTNEAEIKQQAKEIAGQNLEKGDGYCLISQRAYYTLKANDKTVFSVIVHLNGHFTELVRK